MCAIDTGTATFCAAFSAIFAISNPIGCAIIFNGMMEGVPVCTRYKLARRVAVYSGLVLVLSISTGALLMNQFGLTLSGVRIAGGFVVAVQAWRLLDADHRPSNFAYRSEDALVPLTIPFTTGPGTISVAIGLGGPTAITPGSGLHLLSATTAAGAVAILIAGLYSFSNHIAAALGSNGARVTTRLSAFLLLCEAVEIVLRGVHDALMP